MATISGSLPFAKKIIPDNRPRQMVLGTNFLQPAWSEPDLAIPLTVLSQPTSAAPVTVDKLTFDGATEAEVTIPASASFPYSIAFTPFNFGSVWQWGVASWSAMARIRAVSANGDGVAGDLFSISVNQSSSYFITDADWTFAEERDYTLAGGLAGRPRVTVSGSRVIPAGLELRVYTGELAYSSENFTTIHNTANSPLIAAGDNTLYGIGHIQGARVNGVLLWREINTNKWHQASSLRSYTVQGVIDPALPVMTAKPTITGNGKIGTAQTGAAGSWTGAISYSYQWMNGDAETSGATTLSYMPVSADDLDSMRLRVRAYNIAGAYTEAFSDPITITYPAPTVVGSIGDHVYTQESGSARSIDCSGVFGGAGFSVAITAGPAGNTATFNNSTLALAIDLSSPLANTVVTLTATNSGGSIQASGHVQINAVGSALAPVVGAVGGSNGGSTNPAFTAYSTDDMILAFVFQNSSATAISAPTLSGFSGQYLWNAISGAAGQLTSVAGAIFWRRAASGNVAGGVAGTDGLLGPWPSGAAVRYVAVSNVDWTNPVGAAAATLAAGSLAMDHPGLTLAGGNSVVFDFAAQASNITGGAPGLRPDATLLAQNTGSGVRNTLASSTAIPAPAWAAATAVANTVVTGNAGRGYAGAVEVRGGSAATSVVWPSAIAQNLIEVTEVTDPAVATAQGYTGQSGHLKMVTSASLVASVTTVSGTFTLVHELRGGATGAPGDLLPAVSASQTYYTVGVVPVGSNAYPRAYWKLGSGDTAKYKLAWSATPFEVLGLAITPGSGLPACPAATLTLAQARPVAKWTAQATDETGQANDLRYSGPAPVVEAYASLAGTQTADAGVLAQIRAGLAGADCISAAGGISAENDLIWAALIALARINSRIWNVLISTERLAIDALMDALAIAAAATTADSNTSWRAMNIAGNANVISGTSDWRAAQLAILYCYRVYKGSDAAVSNYLESLTATNLQAQTYDRLVASGLTNAAATWNPTRPTGSKGIAPSYTQIAAACHSWTWSNYGIAQRQDMLVAAGNAIFGKLVQSGIGGGYGVTLNDSTHARGKLAAGASGMPYRGSVDATTGIETPNTTGMLQGFNTTDTGLASGTPIGPATRSSAAYAVQDHQPMVIWMLVLMCANLLDKTQTAVKNLQARMNVGITHLKYCTEQGYNDYATGGSGDNNLTPFKKTVAFNYSSTNTSTIGVRWGLDYRWSLWTDILVSWFNVTPVNVKTVNSVTGLSAAILAAQGGDIIEMVGGSYAGTITSTTVKKWSPAITIRCQDKNNPPVFSTQIFNLQNWDGLILSGFSFVNTTPDVRSVIAPFATYLKDCKNLTFIDCYFEEWCGTVYCYNVQNCEIAYNTVVGQRIDNFRLYEDMSGGHVHHNKTINTSINAAWQKDDNPGRHPDSCQLACTSDNNPTNGFVYEDNYTAGNQLVGLGYGTKGGTDLHGFFMHSEVVAGDPSTFPAKAHKNIVCRRNYFSGGNAECITFSGVQNVTCDRNKIEFAPGQTEKGQNDDFYVPRPYFVYNSTTKQANPCDNVTITNNAFPKVQGASGLNYGPGYGKGGLTNIVISGNIDVSTGDPPGWADTDVAKGRVGQWAPR